IAGCVRRAAWSISPRRHSVDNRPLIDRIASRRFGRRAELVAATKGRQMPDTNAVGPEVRQFILSSLPPSKAQKQLALVVLLGILVVVFVVTGPLSHLRTSPVAAFLPIYVTTMIATDSITAILLFTQFVILRSRAILVIAIGYAFTALVLIPYLLTFPGLFGSTGVIDGPLSTAWFFVVWRTGFPSFVIGYALLKDADAGRR